MIKLELDRKKHSLMVKEQSDVSSLQNGFYGQMKRGIIYLSPEEALYVMDIRNGRCYDDVGNEFAFNDVAALFVKNKKLLARYLTYKDYRDKGLILRNATEAEGNYGRSISVKYKGGHFELDAYSFEGLFFPNDLITLVDEEKVGKELYERYWIGQFGTYKAAHRGKISKLDIYETIYLLKHGELHLKNSNLEQVEKFAKKRIKFFTDMYLVYEDWRKRGYVIKTGFKFGTHFRIYFPGASPVRSEDEWMHSKHVIHVFPRKHKQIISEWARAIRVAHSVKKTFILAIPGKKAEIKVNPKKPRLDFVAYHRKKGGIETPKDGTPRYLMYSLTEDEYIGGEELAKALAECNQYGLEMIMGISDRESSVTYYVIKAIDLPGSEYEYYEIEWIQP
ncbi:tRNA-splicing endonuclease [Candidatus Bilamarchaeum dharawalense]|uniref:tRNA-splicing endonuclease n=1 Tax=Candidatus Bilamarchaeum dharawalense TaxID=2885759 RepID=A0A5E4LLM0_9ARCH|nr:tRNA-splicing endonuclease [Candidatus Bilamarchaeum dharawalense]